MHIIRVSLIIIEPHVDCNNVQQFSELSKSSKKPNMQDMCTINGAACYMKQDYRTHSFRSDLVQRSELLAQELKITLACYNDGALCTCLYTYKVLFKISSGLPYLCLRDSPLFMLPFTHYFCLFRSRVGFTKSRFLGLYSMFWCAQEPWITHISSSVHTPR